MKIHRIHVPSQCLKRDIPVNIVIPDTPSGKWLLLLHGYGGNQNEWLEKSAITEYVQKYDLTLVMPGSGDGYYEDTKEPMGCFLGEELPAFLQNNFPLSSKRNNAYIGGCSMGGFGSILLGARYCEVYGKIVSFGGAFIIHDVAIGNPGVLGNADVNYFRKVFGDFSTLEGSTRDPLFHIQKAANKGKMGSVWLQRGTDDVLYRNNEKMYEELRQMAVPVELISTAGGHRWSTWNQHIKAMMEWLVNQP